MTDYGHPLWFGSFLTPSAADPAQTVALAVLSEQIGLDLVTFQDHPYQPALLDTWTLLSHVAARTTSVRLAPNVACLPLRPPAVLARAVAGLDLLSGGRIELGLGAGAYWDAIAAMGGRRLRAGEAVRALEEAIAVLRQLWDTGGRGGARVDGQFHHVLGAKRGPAPAHPVGIWLGAYKPRMLELTGRLADGWLPTAGYLGPGELAAGNAAVDAAATAAGRSPGAVRRLLNVGEHDGPSDRWAHELAALALEHGVSAFILGSDDPQTLRRYAGEVAPAVREIVAAARRPDGPPAPKAATTTVAAPVRRGAFAVVPTPDDGTRRSRARAWDEATRPSGPAPDPQRTYTAHENALGRHLVDVHDALRAELAQIHDLLDQVAAGSLDVAAARSRISEMTIRQNKWTVGAYCESYCRMVTVHHTLEDTSMFPHLRGRDPRLGPVLDRLEEEHRVIHEVLEGLDRALVSYVAGPGGTADLRSAVDLLSDTLLSHLAYEERELVEPIARLGLS